jgi:hypothetical protein
MSALVAIINTTLTARGRYLKRAAPRHLCARSIETVCRWLVRKINQSSCALVKPDSSKMMVVYSSITRRPAATPPGTARVSESSIPQIGLKESRPLDVLGRARADDAYFRDFRPDKVGCAQADQTGGGALWRGQGSYWRS